MQSGQSGIGDRPIFILGLLGRSGTNYLSDLLRLHPGTALPAPIWEDHLLRNAGHLLRYADALEAFFAGSHPEWGAHEGLREDLLHHLGDGMVELLAEHAGPGVRPLTKTPSVEHLDEFFTFFPDAQLLLVVRDGPATVESLVRSFDWSYEYAMHAWAEAATTILDFDRRMGGAGARYRIVRYEDLLTDLDGHLRDLLRFLELDADAYDFAAAHALPVRGSSTLRTGADERVHWDPLPRDGGFDPLARATTWDAHRRERFQWLAGGQLAALGYPPAAPSAAPSPAVRARQEVRDATWRTGRVAAAVKAGLRRRALAQRVARSGRNAVRGERSSRSSHSRLQPSSGMRSVERS